MDRRIMDGIHDVMGPDTGREQRLVRITVRGIHEHDFLLVHDPLGEFLRPHFIEQLPGALRRFDLVCIEQRKRIEIRLFLMAAPA